METPTSEKFARLMHKRGFSGVIGTEPHPLDGQPMVGCAMADVALIFIDEQPELGKSVQISRSHLEGASDEQLAQIADWMLRFLQSGKGEELIWLMREQGFTGDAYTDLYPVEVPSRAGQPTLFFLLPLKDDIPQRLMTSIPLSLLENESEEALVRTAGVMMKNLKQATG